MTRIILNADDFGISHGVNLAIRKAHLEGGLNSTSLMVNQTYVEEAVAMAKEMPNLNLGLHLNLTNEYPTLPATELPLLTGKDGKFSCGFVKLLLLSFLKPKELRQEVQKETEAQIKKALAMRVKLSHIDSHRHIHVIPLIFTVVKKLSEQYKISRIRTLNENAFDTLRQVKDYSCFKSGGVIKYIILQLLTWWNRYPSKGRFFSMLYTCDITEGKLSSYVVPQGYDYLEIMIHPGMPEIDKNDMQNVFDTNILNPARTAELQTALNKTLLERLQHD
jgi:predicted glycoside hydrolase/deacetylase ChbG (UPF0249 family)